MENVYADGALYRLELPAVSPAPAASAPSYAPDEAQRPAARRPLTRQRAARQPAVDPSTVVQPPTMRRAPVRSLRDIARRLAQTMPPSPTAELPPEVLIVEEPLPTHQAPALPALNRAGQIPGLPQSPPTTAPAIEPPVDDVATLVEVCTPWEPINDAVAASMVIFHETPLSLVSPESLVNVAIDPLMQPAENQSPTNSVDDVSAAASWEPKTFRLDPPVSQGINTPHFSPVPSLPAVEPEVASDLAPLTPEETASLLGTTADEPVAEPAAEVSAASGIETENLTAPPPLVPMWEVDRFQWPGLCDRLLKDEQSYFAQAGNKLVAAAKDGLKALGVTGSRRGEGRTTLALCLARCAAQAGLEVALIDADFTRPQLASVMGLEVAYGWQDAAQGKIPLAEAAVKSLTDKITVLPLEASSVAWPLALSDKRVSATFRAVAQSHDLVIVDMGPLASSGESIFAADEAAPLDAVIVLCDMRYATPAETQAVGQRLHESGIEAVGVAENFVRGERVA